MNNIYNSQMMSGKKIVVAGATSGLGLAVAQACADLGATIIALGRSQEKLQKMVAALNTTDVLDEHLFVAGDLSTFESSAHSFSEVLKITGGVDGVFYSAGSELIQPTRSLSRHGIDQTMGAALYGALGASKICSSKRFWRHSEAGASGGSLVFMSSVSAKSGQAGMAAYSAARSGVLGLTRSLSQELAPINVRVNAIIAGAVNTEMHERITSRLSSVSALQYNQSHPLGTGMPSDISNAGVFLLSNAARWITGSELIIDGGFLA